MRQGRLEKKRDFWGNEIDCSTLHGDMGSLGLSILLNLIVRFTCISNKNSLRSKNRKTLLTLKDRDLCLRKLSLLLKSTLGFQRSIKDLTQEELYQSPMLGNPKESLLKDSLIHIKTYSFLTFQNKMRVEKSI